VRQFKALTVAWSSATCGVLRDDTRSAKLPAEVSNPKEPIVEVRDPIRFRFDGLYVSRDDFMVDQGVVDPLLS
jgi:hypothetical protein